MVESVTVSPPAGAGPTSATVQVALFPAVKRLGVQDNVRTGTIPTDSVKFCERPFSDAVTVTSS